MAGSVLWGTPCKRKQTAQLPAWEQYRECFNKGKATAQLTSSGLAEKWSQNREKKDKDTDEKKNEKITCLERKAQEGINGYHRKARKGSKRLEVRQNKYNIDKLQMKRVSWCKPAITVTPFKQWWQQLLGLAHAYPDNVEQKACTWDHPRELLTYRLEEKAGGSKGSVKRDKQALMQQTCLRTTAEQWQHNRKIGIFLTDLASVKHQT